MRRSSKNFLWVIFGCVLGLILGGGLLGTLRAPQTPQNEKRPNDIPQNEISSIGRRLNGERPNDSVVNIQAQKPLIPSSSRSTVDGVSVPIDSNSSANASDSVNPKRSDDSSNAETATRTFGSSQNQATVADFLNIQKQLQSLRAEYWSKRDDLLENLPKTQGLIEKLKNAAQTADEYKTAIAVEQDFQTLQNQLATKRRNYVSNEMKRIRLKLDELKATRTGLPDSVLEPLALLTQDSRNLTNVPLDSPELAWNRESLANELNLLARNVKNRSAIMNALTKYDAVYQRTGDSQKILLDLARRFPGTSYAADFVSVANNVEFYNAIDDWNRFVLENGDELNRFSISSDKAQKLVDFYQTRQNRLYFLEEWSILTRRSPQWTILANDVQIQAKILKLLEHLSRQNYWIYQENDRLFYLTKEPSVGVNEYQANLFGDKKSIYLTKQAVETIEPAKQNAFLRELQNDVASLDDSLQKNDVGQWYAKWGVCLEKVRADNAIDPIVKFFVLKDICSTLADGDFFFRSQLVPWLKILENPKFNSQIDWFDVSNSDLPNLRTTANELLTFLPRGHFKVDKTTRELDASVPRVEYCYQRVGWLDLDLSERWFCRPLESDEANRDRSRRNISLFDRPKSSPNEKVSASLVRNETPRFDAKVSNQKVSNQNISVYETTETETKRNATANSPTVYETSSTEEPSTGSFVRFDSDDRFDSESTFPSDSRNSIDSQISTDSQIPADSRISPRSPSEFSGELLVLLGETPTRKAQWIRIGRMENNQAKIEIVSSELKRGSPVFCRVRIR